MPVPVMICQRGYCLTKGLQHGPEEDLGGSQPNWDIGILVIFPKMLGYSLSLIGILGYSQPNFSLTNFQNKIKISYEFLLHVLFSLLAYFFVR